ncbi:ASCH domain-containing protein [Streptomyces sp. NPDC005374]|uniref:ASCH domain-containing protein n=1 Tax=Streptomyces sp. NPDC005374 TaxID=3364713 RepID=UPI00368ACA00
MTDSERALLLSLHPRFATSILDGRKSVELRRQRVAVPPGTPVVLYATSPVMAFVGTARVARVDTASPSEVWKRHRSETGISRAEYDTYMDGAAQASALLLEAPERLEEPVPLAHLRAGGAFHPPQSYRYIAEDTLHGLVTGHAMADVLLDRLIRATSTASAASTAHTAGGAVRNSLQSSPGSRAGHSALRSAVLLVGPAS